MTFAEKLKILRIKNEYSQEQLAEQLCVSRQAVTKWESGGGMPDVENLKAIAQLFDVTLDSLLLEEEELESTDEAFCMKLAFGCAAICGGLGWMLMELFDLSFMSFALGGGIIGYAAGYVYLLLRKKKKV